MEIVKVVAFARWAAEAELRALHAEIVEPDDDKFRKVVGEWDAMFSGPNTGSGIRRPGDAPASKYQTPERAEAAADLKARSVFAVARYQQGKSAVYRAWMGDIEPRPLGEGILENLYIEEQEGSLKIVSRYYRCATCLGRTTRKSGEPCPDCGATGFEYGNGRHVSELETPVEVVTFAPPTDGRAKAAWDAIVAAREQTSEANNHPPSARK